MKFGLRRPCKECPFRTNIRPYLHPERVRDITDAILKDNKTFTCHKTITGEQLEDEDGEDDGYRPGPGDHMCAGALALIEKTGAANQMTQLAERLGLWDRSKLDLNAPVFDSAEAMIEAQE